MHVLFVGAAAILIFWYLFYYIKACKDQKYFSESVEHYQEFMDNVFTPLSKFIWITFFVLGIIFFMVGCSMLNRLRIYFKDFFEKFGGMLWFANIMLTLPLSFRAVFDALYHNETWSKFWNENYYTVANYNALLFFFGSYVPMLMQIFSLVFGFVRHK